MQKEQEKKEKEQEKHEIKCIGKEKKKEKEIDKKMSKINVFPVRNIIADHFQIIPIKGQRCECPKYESLVKLCENSRK